MVMANAGSFRFVKFENMTETEPTELDVLFEDDEFEEFPAESM